MSGSRALIFSSSWAVSCLMAAGRVFSDSTVFLQFRLFCRVGFFFELAHQGAEFLGRLILLGLEFLEVSLEELRFSESRARRRSTCSPRHAFELGALF